MKIKSTALMLALVMLVQIFAPEMAWAKSSEPAKKTTAQLVKMGALDPKTYPKLDNKAILAIQKQARRNQNRFRTGSSGFFSVGSPYLPGQNPSNDEKAAAYGNLRVDFVAEGLNDNGVMKPFQWNEIFGTDSNGNPGTANIYFVQRDVKNNQKITTFKLTVDKAGKYSLNDIYGKPAKLPLYSKALEPYKYEVELETGVSEKITLLTMELSNTGSETSSYTTDSEGKLVADIPLYLKIGQTASTKFVSKWNTNVQEANRPKVVGGFNNKTADDFNYFPFPTNDTDVLKTRREEFNLENDEWPGYMPQTPLQLREVPKVTVDEDKLEDPETYTIDKNAKRITATDGKVYKYDLEYDVINGGKLTMTEVLPVTFDANGGKFASITDPAAEQKIVKEVDYDGTLTDTPVGISKYRETFKGWGIKNAQNELVSVTDAAFKDIKEAKTFYAMWDNNEITADELEVKESFANGTEYVNDFLPTFDQLKAVVKIKDGSGTPQALGTKDKLEILGDDGNPVAEANLKTYLYGKLKEDPSTGVYKNVTLKAQVTPENGTPQKVDIKIRVIKNIYEAKTLAEKPYYVPDDYVKVTLDPTTKAQDPQKTYYYVNPKAKVVIPGEDPVGARDNKFVKWTIPGTPDPVEYKLKDQPRHQFKTETTITAQYVSDVIPQTGTTKPDHVPKGFVEVKFVATDKATDATKADQIFWVNPAKEVTIPVKSPVGKQYFTFQEWKMGADAKGETYTVGKAKKFEQATIITATYEEAKNIIPYDPKEPTTRPVGYVRITFEAETGLKFTENKAYYVKQNAKDAQGQPLTLANAGLAKPGVSAETGYKFENKWEPADTTKIETTDIVVKAKATPIPDTVEKKDGEEAPTGYVEVKFVAGDNGKLTENNADIAEKTYYVNPNKYVTLTPPTAVGNTGYEFGAWDKDAKIPTQYTVKETTITASFNELKAVVPKTKKDDSEKPAGYTTVTFVVPRENEEKGYIFSGSTKVYYVDPNREVTLIPPLVKVHPGYKFDKWDQDTTKTAKKYTTDTTVNASFTRLPDIISSIDGEGKPTAKPDEYVTVVFNKGEHGSLKGVKTYYVNPAANKTVGDLVKAKPPKEAMAPKVTPDTGYEFTSWSRKDNEVITDKIDVYIITAQYKALDDVIPQKKTDGTDKPKDYITVTFEKGDHGKELTGQAVYYVNPNKVVVLEDKAPTAVPNAGYTFARWDTSIERAIQYKDGDKITALYNEPGTISKTEVAGYVKVEFKPGTNGELKGTTEYWIKPGVEVNIPAPTVNPKVGYKFDKWDNPLTVTKQLNDSPYTITATYAEEQAVIPKTKTDDSEKPSGYVTVTFGTDGNGSLEGTTTYFVNPNKEADFTQTAANMTKKPKIGYTEKGGSWTPTDFKKTFTENAEFKFSFVELKNVIPPKENEKRPEGYVTLTLIPTDKATDQTKANKSYWVKANTDISILSKPTGKTEKLNEIEYTYTFKGWTVTRGTIASWDNETIAGKFIQDTEITAQYTMSADWKDLFTPVEPKDNAVTPVGDTPKPEDLIGNPYNPEDPDNKDNLPDGTDITYVTEPKVDKDGKVTAKVKIKYPGGKTTIIDVPLTVVKNVVPQVGGENGQKPLVPANYVKVTVDTTDKATDNTKFTKVFWVKPNEQVTIPDILDPTGKKVTEDDVTKTNNFKKWKLEGSNPEKTYAHGNVITDTFTAEASKIVAVYEQDKNVEPKPNNNLDVPQGSTPSAKNFIKNIYDDSDPNNKNNLPPGTSFAFDGGDPDTSTPGTNKTTKIKVTYPNGETKTVDVTYNVTEDVVEQTDPKQKPDVPERFVKVTVKTTDKATDATAFEKVFWVDPNKEVTIPVGDPVGKVGPDDHGKTVQWQFTGWDNPLKGKFTRETTIAAQYVPAVSVPGSVGYLVTEEGVQPTADQYKSRIEPPVGKTIDRVEIVKEPDVSKPGVQEAGLRVTYDDGTSSDVTMTVFVQRKPQTDWQTGTLGSTRILTVVEKEVVKVPAEKTFRKEVRYMQGFNNYFRPTEGLTRAEAAQILANALVEDGYRYDPNFAIHYKDIVGNEWYAKAIRITSQANVFKGYDTGYFDPHKKITRAEWIGTLRRFQELERAPGNHMQVRPDHWAMGEIEAAYKEGWLAIYGQGLARFNADEFIPRQEVAAVSNKAFNRVLDKTYIHRNSKNLINYKDVNPSMWSYEDILCASNGYLHDGKSFWGHKIDYKKDLYNINLDGYTVRKDKFQRLERR